MSSKKHSSNRPLLQKIERYFSIKARKSSLATECLAGGTTFLAMLYSIVVIPNMLSEVGFNAHSVFIATCLLMGFGSLLMGLWANLPMAIGCAVSLTAFLAYGVVQAQGQSIANALGAVFWMGCLFTLISITGIRAWLLRNIPQGIAQGIGIGIGLFLFFIAVYNAGIVIRNDAPGLPLKLGDISQFSVYSSILGLAAIVGLEKLKVPGSIFIVILISTLLTFCINPVPVGNSVGVIDPHHNIFGGLNIFGALSLKILPIIFALMITAVFDATGTIRALAEQAELLDEKGQIIDSKKALTSDSISSVVAGLLGTAPAAVYIESASGTAAGGRTGLTAVIVGLLFLIMIFFAPMLQYIPSAATAPALMYVGVLMLSNVRKLNFSDSIDALSGLITAVFILLTCNIVTGIMFGFLSLCVGRLFAKQWRQLNYSVIIITAILLIYYYSGWAI